jgi:hypothetical protein
MDLSWPDTGKTVKVSLHQFYPKFFTAAALTIVFPSRMADICISELRELARGL